MPHASCSDPLVTNGIGWGELSKHPVTSASTNSNAKSLQLLLDILDPLCAFMAPSLSNRGYCWIAV